MSELELKVPVGSLVTIVGQTGSGKSSVLAAALGLMNQVSGPAPEVHGKVSNAVFLGQSGVSCSCGALPAQITDCHKLAIAVCLSKVSRMLRGWSA